MAKRRNKNKARRALVGLNRNVSLNAVDKASDVKMDGKSDNIYGDDEDTIDDPPVTVQVTENVQLDEGATENVMESAADTETPKKDEKQIKSPKYGKKKSPKLSKCESDGNCSDEILIFPTEIDGETCLDIQCGANEAFMYLGKLCVGSKGSCVKFNDNWLTPNEFQAVSGRETAKDWKRSIRHRSKSLKLLINKGLVVVHPSSPKKAKAAIIASPTRAVTEATIKKEKKCKYVKPTSESHGESLKAEVGDTGNAAVGEPTPPAIPALSTQSHDVQQPKKRGRKPKRQRGRRPGEAGDKARKAQDALHVTSFSLGRLQDKPEKDADDGSEGKDNRPEVDAPSSPADTRTDEERRLDEFVKTLRLTKTTALTKVPDVPKLDSADVANITKRDVSSDHGDVDPEMPVLQKEGLAGDSFVKTHPDISVSVDALNATVTPPPTPPSERVGIEQNINAIDGGKLVETFKSTLASPSVGLKLKINREKVKLDMPITDNEVKPADKEQSKLDSAVTQNVEIKIPVSAPKQNLQSMMLQDALLSARKYKEQLLQNRQTSPVKTPNTASPKPLTTYPDSLKSKPVTMPTLSSTSVKLEPTTESQNGLNSATVINGRVAGVKQERAAKMEPSVAFPSLQYGQMPSMDDMRRLSAMPFKDFMSVMASVYGPLPFPFGNKDAAFATLKDLQQKHDMLRLLTQQGEGQEAGEQAALLYPMITQQLLLAMTQQLYSMCNVPAMHVNSYTGNPPSHTSHIQQREQSHARIVSNVQAHSRPVADVKRELTNRNPTSEIHKRPVSQALDDRHRMFQYIEDCANRKRKHIEVDENGALDLSVKRRKTETVSTKPSSILEADGPLDFSMKTKHSKRSDPSMHDSSLKSVSQANGYKNNIHPMKNGYAQRPPSIPNHTNYGNRFPKSSLSGCTCGGSGNEDITTWGVDQVCHFLVALEGCAIYAKTFHDQGISGRVLPYLTTQHLTRTLGMKVGPALTLIQAIERHRAERHVTSTSAVTSPCAMCRSLMFSSGAGAASLPT